MKQFWTVFDKILDLMAALAGLILIFITAATCYSIGMRYLFRISTIWIAQTTEYALLWMVFLSTTWLLREGGHIITDIIYSHLNEKTRQYLDCIMLTIGGLACFLMVYYGTADLYHGIIAKVTDVRAVTVPKWTVSCIIPVGSILLTIQFFRMAWGRLTDIRTGR